MRASPVFTAVAAIAALGGKWGIEFVRFPYLLSPGAGLIVLCGYVLAILLGAGVALAHRDA